MKRRDFLRCGLVGGVAAVAGSTLTSCQKSSLSNADTETIQTPQGQSAVIRYLDIRLNDLRHQMTTNFQTRSRGFQWFFSFIVAFSKYEGNPNVIILLDEPGLGLHARAQADFLRFIEEKLSSETQVIYTTHSPFLIDRRHPERVLMVHKDKTGTKVDDSSYRENWKPLRKEIGLTIGDLFFFSDQSLVLELPTRRRPTIFSKFRADEE